MGQVELELNTDTPAGQLPRTYGWRLAAAQQRGTSHETTGEVCQDAYSLAMLSPEVLLIAVADGAGSAKYAQIGASLAASCGLGQLCAGLAEAEGALDEITLKDILYTGLVAARRAVEAEAATRQVNAHDLATTLILVIARAELIAVAQVGDGATVIADQTGKFIGLTLPPVGEYINEATFITSAEALRTAQTTVWHGQAAQLAAFSDGLQLLCLKWPECRPHEAFFAPLFQFIKTTTDELQAEHELVSFLSSERIKELTDDDLTLVLASRTNHANEC
jgi:Protein phosphatase 2C